MPRVQDVPASRIAGRSDLALAQRMPDPHRTNEAVPEQRLRTQLRTHGLANDACFQIDAPVAKRRTVSIRLRHKAQPHAGSFLAGACNEIWTEIFHEAVTYPQRECTDQPF